MLPKAIQQQVEEAEQMMASMTNGAPAPDADTRNEAQTPEHVSAEPKVEVSQATPAPAPQEPSPWENKYNVLRGKYDAEVPRLHDQIRELRQAHQQMMAEVERLKTQSAEQPSLVTDADREAFGEDLVSLAERVAKQNLKPLQDKLAKLEAENASLHQSMARTEQEVQITSQDAYRNKLTALVPNWEAVNQDHGFLVWLGQTDPVFGVQRQEGLNRAYSNLDAHATAAIFNAYMQTVAPAAKPKSPKDELQSQVAPTRSRSVAAPVTDEWSSKIWTGREIEHFYNEQRRGAYTLADADRISNEIDRAVAEGRVRA